MYTCTRLYLCCIRTLYVHFMIYTIYDIIIADEVSHALFRCLLGSVQRKPWRWFGHPGCFPMANLRIHKKLLLDQCPGRLAQKWTQVYPNAEAPHPFTPWKGGFQLALKVIPRIAPLVQPKSEDSRRFPKIGDRVQLESPSPRHVCSSEEESLGRQLGWCCSILPVLVNCQLLWFVRFVLIHHPYKSSYHLTSFWTPPKPISSYLKSNLIHLQSRWTPY